jgi:hypothetical protein
MGLIQSALKVEQEIKGYNLKMRSAYEHSLTKTNDAALKKSPKIKRG